MQQAYEGEEIAFGRRTLEIRHPVHVQLEAGGAQRHQASAALGQITQHLAGDLVMDEYADMRSYVWEEILRPALADRKGGALFIGTPMGRNHFYDLYTYAKLADDATYTAYHFTSYDNPTLDPAEIDAAKKSMSSFAFRQEFLASFEAKGSEMFKEEWVKFGEEPEEGDYYIAIDPAGAELFTWGPRPAPAQHMILEHKALPLDEQPPYREISTRLHTWYAQDRTATLQAEFTALMKG